ncbi:MAG: GNAT family N-acetyltransferase [Halobacteria archaeon]|nr:GNAT family N-acetyltransferase [Halobacteria archaeon]
MSENKPSFDTKDRQQVYEYVEENEPVEPDELVEEEVVPVTPQRAKKIVGILRRDGYLEEEFGRLRVSTDDEDESEYEAEEIEFTVRTAKQEDLSGLVGVVRQITEEETYIFGERVGEEMQSIVDYIDSIVHDESESSSMFFVAVVDGEVIGWIDLREPDAAKLEGCVELTMGLLDEFRGHGIGGHLLEHAHDWAKSRSYRKVFSNLPETNQDAIDFLEENGWEIEATRPDHYLIDGDTVDEVLISYRIE